MGRADVLFRFLQIAGKDAPKDIEPYLKDLDEDTERRPLVDQIVDRMLAQNPQLYKQYAEAQREVGSRNPYASPMEYPEEDNYEKALRRFISRWVAFEASVRTLAMHAGDKGGNIFVPLSRLIREIDISDKAKHDIALLQRLRNETIHGIATPAPEELNEAAKALEQITKSIKAKTSSLEAEIGKGTAVVRSRRTKS